MDVKRLLVIAPNWLGDAVMSLPLVARLTAVPGLRLTIAARDYVARVFWGVDDVDDVIVLDKRLRGGSLRRSVRVLRRLRFDGCVLLPPSFSSALLAFAARIPIRVGYASDGRSALLSHALGAAGLRDEHLGENYLRLGRVIVKSLGLEAPPGGVERPELRVTDGDRLGLDDVLAKAGAPKRGFAVVVPGATYGPTKKWPTQKYRSLVERLSQDLPVVLCGTPAEAPMCGGIARGAERVTNLAGRTSIGQLFALLERAEVVVANDSGAPHAAAAVGTPVVVLFGSTSPTWTRPLGERVHVVREPVPCSPCFRSTCPTKLECFQGIAPERVFEVTRRAASVAEETV